MKFRIILPIMQSKTKLGTETRVSCKDVPLVTTVHGVLAVLHTEFACAFAWVHMAMLSVVIINSRHILHMVMP